MFKLRDSKRLMGEKFGRIRKFIIWYFYYIHGEFEGMIPLCVYRFKSGNYKTLTKNNGEIYNLII